MKILNTQTTKRGIETVVEFNKKKFLRIKTNRFVERQMNSVQVIEWKRLKTNHLVDKNEHQKLESEFAKVDTTTTPLPKDSYKPLTVSGYTTINTFNTSEKTYDEDDKKYLAVKIAARQMLEKEKASFLQTVKFIKDSTGYGLKISKDIADALVKEIELDKKYEEAKRNMFDKPKVATPGIRKR